ncbi:hypothetical protein BTI62_04155 [Lactobacillus delbrueckii subsp. bulgaricus]|nr:hypothetical protein [Lactobacillus delbrueckii subsp. bulgaricus]MBT8922892.1 hypothetical protein [Lactobacillus delbrueckii subsp. bulgaricus]
MIPIGKIVTPIGKIVTWKRNLKRRKGLQNKDFTILSSNCTGGVIYHDLGLQFKSPTINLWFKPKDYLKFISNLNKYLSMDLVEETETALGYPVGLLGDIYLCFFHYRTFEDAKNKWNSRKKRINKDNIYVIFTDRDGFDDEDFQNFLALPYKHKILLAGDKKYSSKYTKIISKDLENGHLGDIFTVRNRFTGKRLLDEFDYVSFLNNRLKLPTPKRTMKP